MARRGRKRLLPSPTAPGPEAVPARVREDGRCADGSTIRLFDAAMDGEQIDEAKAVCAGCPALEMCLRYAIGNEARGVWGGTTPAERSGLRALDLVHSPDERREAHELRVEIRSGRLHEHIAQDRNVHVRTLARWITQDVESAGAA